jgi:serine protease Do
LASRGSAGTLPEGTADLVARLLPQAVRIEAVHYRKHTPTAADPRPYDRITEDGSGFIIDPAGLIITNHHVIAAAEYIDVILHDRTRLHAELVYSAPIDMVLLKVRASKPLPITSWGDSDKMRQGDSVIAIGNPLGIGISVSAGVISALDRNIGETAAAIAGGADVDNMLQTDAALNHGNSGGPLFNLAGEVIGINTAIISPTTGSAGIGFAIPSRDALFILDQYKRYGRFRPGYIGAHVQQMGQDLASSVGLSGPPRGVMVDKIVPNGPAAQAGLLPGDVILTIRDLSINDPRDYIRAVLGTPFDTTQPIVIWRGNAEHTLQVAFREGPDRQPPAPPALEATAAMPKQRLDARLGLTLAALTPQLRDQYSIKGDQPGLVVTDVKPLSIAYDRGLQAGDILEQFQDSKITSNEVLRRAVEEAETTQAAYARVLIRRQGQVRWYAMPLFADPPP